MRTNQVTPAARFYAHIHVPTDQDQGQCRRKCNAFRCSLPVPHPWLQGRLRFQENYTKTKVVESVAFDTVMQKKPTKLTDLDMTYHVWGTGRMAWYVLVCARTSNKHQHLLSPGRFYAAAVMKVILGQILINYNCEFAELGGKRLFSWRSTILPKPNLKVIFTPLSNA